MGVLPLDFVHVHEPFAPSTASAALRHSRALNVGSFHAPTERLLSTQVARRFVELFFGRLDARIASYAATAALMRSHFPADYRVIGPVVDAPAAARSRSPATSDRLRRDRGARRAAQLPARAAPPRRLRGLGGDDPAQRRRRRRGRVAGRAAQPRQFRRGRRGRAPRVLGGADVVVLASSGALPAPALALAAIGAGAVPLASRIEVYEELLAGGERGLLFEPGDVDTLAAQLRRLAEDRALRERLARASDGLRASLSAERVVDQLEAVYATVAARRREPFHPSARRLRAPR